MARKKIALLVGITGQDGSYMAELLLERGFEVHGVIRRSSLINTDRIDSLFNPESREFIHYGDLADQSIVELIYKIKPDWVINLGAMSHVKVSFDIPEYTGNVTGLGVCRLLEGIRRGIENGILAKGIKYYQASSSEMFGTTEPPQKETSVFAPCSPYGCAKLYAYHMTRAYRNGYKMFASNGILFNHESPRRGIRFVTRKVVRAAVRIKLGLQQKLELGNLDALRDWGHSKDYCEAIIKILEYHKPDDFVVSTGEYYSVKEFVIKVFKDLGLNWEDYVTYSESLTRPNEVPALLGDSTKIRNTLGWKPKYTFDTLVQEMVDSEMAIQKKELK